MRRKRPRHEIDTLVNVKAEMLLFSQSDALTDVKPDTLSDLLPHLKADTLVYLLETLRNGGGFIRCSDWDGSRGSAEDTTRHTGWSKGRETSPCTGCMTLEVEAKAIIETLVKFKAKAVVTAQTETLSEVEAQKINDTLVKQKGRGTGRCFGRHAWTSIA